MLGNDRMETASTEVTWIHRRNDIQKSICRSHQYFVDFESRIHVLVELMSYFPRGLTFQNQCNFHELSTWNFDVESMANRRRCFIWACCHEIPVELIKYAPDRIHEQIDKIYNNMAETGDIPKEVTYRILKPLQKPNKAKGSSSNLGPIILLSSLCKILAACITNRIKDKLEAETLLSQAAYRPNRSTTGHVFTSKLIMKELSQQEMNTLI